MTSFSWVFEYIKALKNVIKLGNNNNLYKTNKFLAPLVHGPFRFLLPRCLGPNNTMLAWRNFEVRQINRRPQLRGSLESLVYSFTDLTEAMWRRLLWGGYQKRWMEFGAQPLSPSFPGSLSFLSLEVNPDTDPYFSNSHSLFGKKERSDGMKDST